ncbi:Expansin-B16 [Asimina triloba]
MREYPTLLAHACVLEPYPVSGGRVRFRRAFFLSYPHVLFGSSHRLFIHATFSFMHRLVDENRTRWISDDDGPGLQVGLVGTDRWARVGAVSPVLFKDGEGCGACYKVRCSDRSICSRRAVTIIVVDECPGGYCANGRTHFDLSGAAFGRMAILGEGTQLRNRGEISVIYKR